MHTIPLSFKCSHSRIPFKCTHAFKHPQFRCTRAFKRHQFRLIPNAFKRSAHSCELFNVIKTCPKSAPGFASNYIFMATIKQISKDVSLTASTNVVSMQYPNTLPNTKMTLRQLVGPIEVVSPEHSSDDRNHEFQIASQMNACIEFSKAEYARSHQNRIRTLHHFSSFIQICTKPEAFLAHQPKIQDISTPPFEGSFVNPWRRSNGYLYRAKTVSTPYKHP